VLGKAWAQGIGEWLTG
jgi:hypothetical protein